MHKELWQQLIKLDNNRTVQRAKCQYLSEPEHYIVTMLNTRYIVNLEDKQIFSVQSNTQPAKTSFLHQLCILAYLINAKDMPLSGKLVKAQSLTGGQFFFRGPHELPTKKLSQTFGPNPKLLYKAGNALNAEKGDFGDASIKVQVLPRIPLVFVIWAGDEEFEPRASILFDQTAAEHILLDALLVAVNFTVKALVKAIESDSPQ